MKLLSYFYLGIPFLLAGSGYLLYQQSATVKNHFDAIGTHLGALGHSLGGWVCEKTCHCQPSELKPAAPKGIMPGKPELPGKAVEPAEKAPTTPLTKPEPPVHEPAPLHPLEPEDELEPIHPPFGEPIAVKPAVATPPLAAPQPTAPAPNPFAPKPFGTPEPDDLDAPHPTTPTLPINNLNRPKPPFESPLTPPAPAPFGTPIKPALNTPPTTTEPEPALSPLGAPNLATEHPPLPMPNDDEHPPFGNPTPATPNPFAPKPFGAPNLADEHPPFGSPTPPVTSPTNQLNGLAANKPLGTAPATPKSIAKKPATNQPNAQPAVFTGTAGNEAIPVLSANQKDNIDLTLSPYEQQCAALGPDYQYCSVFVYAADAPQGIELQGCYDAVVCSALAGE